METNNSTDINSESIFEEMQLRREVSKWGHIHYYDKKGKLHRNFGPAEIIPGYQCWYQHGFEHRLDGPAVTFASGKKMYYIFGMEYDEEQYWKEVERLKNGN